MLLQQQPLNLLLVAIEYQNSELVTKSLTTINCKEYGLALPKPCLLEQWVGGGETAWE